MSLLREKPLPIEKEMGHARDDKRVMRRGTVFILRPQPIGGPWQVRGRLARGTKVCRWCRELCCGQHSFGGRLVAIWLQLTAKDQNVGWSLDTELHHAADLQHRDRDVLADHDLLPDLPG